MLRDELANLDTRPPALRKFGLSVGLVLLALGGAQGWHHRPIAPVWLGLGALLLVMGLLAPGWLRRCYLGWMALALLMGIVTSTILLTGIYFLLLTPIALLLRFTRRTPMARDFRAGAATYWQPRTAGAFTRADLEQQY